jgi:hypothetical protein
MAKTSLAWLLGLATLCGAAAQEQQDPSTQPAPPVVIGQCPQPSEVDANGQPLLEKFLVRSVTLRHPFAFLPWVHMQLAGLRPRLKVVKDDPYRGDQMAADFKLLNGEFQLPSTDSGVDPFPFVAVVVTVNHCTEGHLDVEYEVLTTQFLPDRSTAEAHKSDLERPEKAANVTRPKTFELVPKAGYNATDRFFGGGSLRVRTKGRPASLDSFNLEGAASNTYQSASGSLNGSFDPEAFGTISWRLGYEYRALPTDRAGLSESHVEGRVLASTRPLGSGGLVFRFGGQLEGGNVQSGFQASELGPDSVAGAAYASVRLYSGATFGTKHTAFRSSYGVEVGGNGGFGAAWRRHVGDASFDAWFPAGSHRPVQIESRFTAGGIHTGTGARIPVAKRFFGGNVQQSFLEGDDWDFRANPVLRSIPAQKYNLTGAGPGADRFYALNLTVAPAIWHQPLLPSEVTDDDGFKSAVKQQWDLAEASGAANLITKDANFAPTMAKLPPVRDALAALSTALGSASGSVSPGNQALFTSCASSVRLATRRVTSALQANPSLSADERYGFLAALVKEGKAQVLPKVVEACLNKLSPALQDAKVTSAAGGVNQSLDDLEKAYAKIDRDGASNESAKQLAYPKRVFDTIIHDLNLWSVSPVFAFDTARIWPEVSSGKGLRYGVGGGIRLTLVSHANLTVGYARNLHRDPKEGSGALFFSISITELLR